MSNKHLTLNEKNKIEIYINKDAPLEEYQKV